MPDTLPSQDQLVPGTPDLILKRHDTWPPAQATLSDQDGPVDLTEATLVKFIMKGLNTGPLVTGDCTVDPDQVTNRGQVSYQWIAEDTAIADVYAVEFEITWSAGETETIPNDAYRRIDIEPDLEDV